MKKLLSIIEERLDEPTSKALALAVSRGLREGLLSPGDRLPPIRTVATELGLSPTTVSAAWGLLARSGAIHTAGRRGTTIAEQHAPGSVRYQKAIDRSIFFELDLSTGVPDPALLPDLGPALRALQLRSERADRAVNPTSYLDDPVLPELREVLRAEWPAPVGDLTVVDGAMDALELTCRSLLRFGDRVIVEHPCFPPLLDLLESIGVEVIGVPVDDEGLAAKPLAKALAQTAKNSASVPVALFLQPRAQNPTGASLTPARAGELVDLLRPTDVWIVEDDSAGAVAATEPISLGRWLPARTVHIRSFSKSHGPDLRLAAMSAPTELMTDIIGRRQLGQGWSSRLLQRILLNLLTDPGSLGEVSLARTEYAQRRASMVQALSDRGVEVGGGDGLNIWIPVVDEPAALVRLASQGIGVTAGAPFAVLPAQTGFIRVTTGLLANCSPQRHAEIADALAAAARTGARLGVRR